MDQNAIEVNNLTKIFQLKLKQPGFLGGLRSLITPQRRSITAVDTISLSIKEGELVAFIGPNGAGKSTSIKMLTGIMFPTSGTIRVLGFSPSQDRQKLAYFIGSVFGQKPQLWYHLSPLDTYNLYSRIYELDRHMYQERLKMLIDAFEIGNLMTTPVRKLSLGQRMRCEIVASLLHKPKVIFLDEPTIGLDVIAKQHIREVILFLNKTEHATIFLTSHDAGDIEALATRTIVINYGKIIFDNTTDMLKKNFIKTKIIELVTEDSLEKFTFDGGSIIERNKHTIKIEIDTAQTPIDKLVSYAVGSFNIKDINIFEPPLEEIIADIYRAQQP